MKKLIATLCLLILGADSIQAQDTNNATQRLRNQSSQFTEEIIKVADHVYVAVGFSVSNVSMIVGDDGVVIIDTGMMLDDAERIVTEFTAAHDTNPTHFLKGERETIEVGGVELELVSSPGETNDQLFAWYPAGKVLFAGDNFYWSFPNLYAIRGTPNRSVRLWAESLGKLAAYDAEAVVGGHTKPITRPLGIEFVRLIAVRIGVASRVEPSHCHVFAKRDRGKHLLNGGFVNTLQCFTIGRSIFDFVNLFRE